MTLFRFNLTCAYFGSSSIFLFGDSSSRVSNFLSYNKGCVDVSEGGKKSDDEAQLTQSPFCPFTLFSTASVMSSSRSVSRGGAIMFHNDAVQKQKRSLFCRISLAVAMWCAVWCGGVWTLAGPPQEAVDAATGEERRYRVVTGHPHFQFPKQTKS